jgi:hypothetical protein
MMNIDRIDRTVLTAGQVALLTAGTAIAVVLFNYIYLLIRFGLAIDQTPKHFFWPSPDILIIAGVGFLLNWIFPGLERGRRFHPVATLTLVPTLTYVVPTAIIGLVKGDDVANYFRNLTWASGEVGLHLLVGSVFSWFVLRSVRGWS